MITNNYVEYINNVNKGIYISFQEFCKKYCPVEKVKRNNSPLFKKFVIKKITKDFYTYKQIKYIKMRKMSSKKKYVTIQDYRGVLYKANIETGEIRHKTRLEVLQNIKNSKARTIKKLREYVQANKWEYFLTLTFNNDLQNRYSDVECLKHLDIYLHWLRRKYPNAYYVCVPEYHKIKALHFHLIIGGITGKELGLKYWRAKKCKSGNGYQTIYKVTSFKYGYTTATKVDNSSACGNYILKYVVKAMGIVETGAKRYFASRNLKLPETSIINNFFYGDVLLKNYIDIVPVLGTRLIYATNKTVVYQIDYNINDKVQTFT